MNPSTELHDLTIQIAQAVSDGDVAVLERHTSRHPGTAFLGTDPDEWWTDLGGLRQALVGQHEAGVTLAMGAYLRGIKGDLDYTNLMADVTWNFFDGPFTPYVTAGAGWSWWDTNIATEPPETGCWWDPWFGYICTTWQDTKTVDGFMYMAGVGARFDVNDRFAVNASYRMNWMDQDKASGTPSMDEFDLMVGWKF